MTRCYTRKYTRNFIGTQTLIAEVLVRPLPMQPKALSSSPTLVQASCSIGITIHNTDDISYDSSKEKNIQTESHHEEIMNVKNQVKDILAHMQKIDNEIYAFKINNLQDDKIGKEQEHIEKGLIFPNQRHLETTLFDNNNLTTVTSTAGEKKEKINSSKISQRHLDHLEATLFQKKKRTTITSTAGEKKEKINSSSNYTTISFGNEDNEKTGHHDENLDTVPFDLGIDLWHDDPSSQENASKNEHLRASWISTLFQGSMRLIFGTPTNENKNEKIPLQNTGTLKMYAIAKLADAASKDDNHHNGSSSKSITPLIPAIFSLLLISFQFIILTYVDTDTLYPTCSTHADCQVGNFCAGTEDSVMRDPRCFSCKNALDFFHPDPQCDSLRQDDHSFDAIKYMDNKVVWFDYFQATFDQELQFNNNDDEQNYLACLAHKHCEDTALKNDDPKSLKVPNYLILLNSKISIDQIIALFFTALLYGIIVTKKLSETTIEETALNAIIDSRPGVKSMPITIKIIHVSLRMQLIVLPLILILATAVLLLTESLSVKNVIVNFLAMTLILESDSLVMNLLNYEEQKMVERILMNNWANKPISFLFPHQSGLLTTFSITVMLMKMKSLVAFYAINGMGILRCLTLFIWKGIDRDFLFPVTWASFLFLLMFVFPLQATFWLVNQRKAWKLEIFRCMGIFFLAIFISFLGLFVQFRVFTAELMVILILSGIGSVAYIIGEVGAYKFHDLL